MPHCEYLPMPGGGVAIVRVAGARRKRCSVCGKPAGRLCDWKTAPGRTCDAPLCDRCTHEPAAGKDLCPTHAKRWAQRQASQRKTGAADGVPETHNPKGTTTC